MGDVEGQQDKKWRKKANAYLNDPRYATSLYAVDMTPEQREALAIQIAQYEEATGEKIELNEDGTPVRKQHYGWWMKITFVICCLMMVIASFLDPVYNPWDDKNPNPFLGPSTEVLIDMGAKYGPPMYEGEVHRFVTAIFLHGGWLHLGMNMWLQMSLGLQLEKAYGPMRMGILYMAAGVAGNLMSVVFLPQIPTVGASGSLFGLVGVSYIDLVRNWGQIRKPMREFLGSSVKVAVLIMFGLFPVVDNFAHIGGFLCGMLLTPTLMPQASTKTVAGKSWKVILILATLPVLVILLMTGFILFYAQQDGNNWCSACTYLNCVNFPIDGYRDQCNGYR